MNVLEPLDAIQLVYEHKYTDDLCSRVVDLLSVTICDNRELQGGRGGIFGVAAPGCVKPILY